MRTEILRLIQEVVPHDSLEQAHQEFAIQWINSGAGLFRLEKPSTPSPHLVSYFVVIDTSASKILLVEHRTACLWLPPGGHVEAEEHPRATVERECVEELGVKASFLFQEPIFITVTETGGFTPGHVDISLWFVLTGDSSKTFDFDRQEFLSVHWFDFSEIPCADTDPHMRRFMDKLHIAIADRVAA